MREKIKRVSCSTDGLSIRFKNGQVLSTGKDKYTDIIISSLLLQTYHQESNLK